MEKEKVKLTDIMNFFGMASGTFAAEWKVLNDEEKQFFREEVAKEVGKVVQSYRLT